MTAPYSATNPPRYLMKKLTKKQDYAILGGTLVMTTAGFYIFWDAYLYIFSFLWKPYDAENDEKFHAAISWHVAFVIGAATAFILTKKWQKRPIYFIAEAVVALSGILMAISWDTLLPIIIARYLGGLGHGLAFLTVIIHTSEIALTNFRANVMGVISAAISTSVFLAFFILAIYTTIDEPSFLIDQTLGVLTVVLAVSGMLCNWTCVESPIFHLERGEREVAVTCLKQVRHDWSKPDEIQAEITEMESLVRTQEISKFPTIKATIRVVILFGLYSLSNFFIYSFYAIIVLQSYFFGLSFVYFGRIAAETLAIFYIDTKGRRLFLTISILGGGVCMGIIGILFSDLETDSWYIWAGLLFFGFNFFVGAGLSPISVVLLGESFHPNQKQLPILLSVAIEHILQIIFLSIYSYSYSGIEGQPLFSTVGVLYILISVAMYIFTPETKQLNLEKCATALS